MGRISKINAKSLIFYLYKDTILPEFLEIVGESKAMDILKVFGGMKVVIPPYRKVLDLKRNIDIYESLCYVNSQESVKALAEKYDITEVWVKAVFKSMKRHYPKILKFLEDFEKCEKILVTTRRNPRNGTDQDINGYSREADYSQSAGT